MYVLLLILLELISETHYFLSQRNDLCLHNEMIADVDECKLAVIQLKEDGSTIKFKYTVSDSNYPRGCFVFAGIDVYWNTDMSGKAQKDSQPFCKIGSN